MHYFWFLRELIAAGYPGEAENLDEEARFRELKKALETTRNTSWNWAVRKMTEKLYDMHLDYSIDSLHKLNEAIKVTANSTDWPTKVVGKIAIKRITVNSEENAKLPGLPGVGCALPNKQCQSLKSRRDELLKSMDFISDLERHAAEIKSEVATLKERGIRGVRVDNVPHDYLGEQAYAFGDNPPSNVDNPDHILTYLYNVFFAALNEHGMLAQLFLGINRWSSDKSLAPSSINDTERIVRLHGLFKKYSNIRFELVMGCELNNMDVVQAARIYPNVNPGGLWWFNFRVSSYMQAMQYRFEALPPRRSAIVATDARCIEWCYIKTLLVKHVMAQFFWKQIQDGWIDAPDSLWAAKYWLHDTAAEHYI